MHTERLARSVSDLPDEAGAFFSQMKEQRNS
jgi:hypothetical protein